MSLLATFSLVLPLIFGPVEATHASPLRVSIDADVFVASELFDASWGKIQQKVTCKNYRAGVVNHHALASDLLAGFFSSLKKCEPNIAHFIILSPDHFSKAHTSVATFSIPYRTRGKDILTAQDAPSFASDQPELFEREHGVGALIPFLVHEFPSASVTALAVKSSISESERADLSEWLQTKLKERNTFVVVSSDMSHYLSERVALAHDQETGQAFVKSNTNFFTLASDGYTDSGPTISLVMKALGKTKWTLMRESISTAYGGSPGFTTSYLVGFWE
ncbi:MAG: AmmeMemoRadiSam system protein B [Candidatus Uhrbacteria bacterium]